ncbi:MAG: hypothetical protein KDC00_01805 [Flavobacteriales bacterium]|nr:hypothetical protein [Flavobacteriales bacterium]
MVFYWFTIIRMLLLRPFRSKVAFDQRIEKSYRVGLLDCDGLQLLGNGIRGPVIAGRWWATAMG